MFTRSVELFRDNDIDGAILLEIDDDLLRDDLELTSKAHVGKTNPSARMGDFTIKRGKKKRKKKRGEKKKNRLKKVDKQG